MAMLTEFKKFAIQGNVLDLAIGIIIGAAFGAIVKAAVDSILMPIVGILIGGIDIKSLKVKVGGAELAYGLFLQSVIEFIIIAFFLFLIVQAVNKMKRKEIIVAPAAPVVSTTDQLLMEIRDELKK
ncbi:MAG: large conductance mechanosensitive channel protein MscL [Chitinophagaceae bacterium]